MIVIKSLVPGGVAQIDGGLCPGDRLLAVNEVDLQNSSLDDAVLALKVKYAYFTINDYNINMYIYIYILRLFTIVIMYFRD